MRAILGKENLSTIKRMFHQSKEKNKRRVKITMLN